MEVVRADLTTEQCAASTVKLERIQYISHSRHVPRTLLSGNFGPVFGLLVWQQHLGHLTAVTKAFKGKLIGDSLPGRSPKQKV